MIYFFFVIATCVVCYLDEETLMASESIGTLCNTSRHVATLHRGMTQFGRARCHREDAEVKACQVHEAADEWADGCSCSLGLWKDDVLRAICRL